MEQTITAREMLALIENYYFKGAGLAAASLTKGTERRAFKMAQIERLLTRWKSTVTLAVWLSDMFWTADEGRTERQEPNPLLSAEGQQTLTKEERLRLRLILEIAGLCHDLTLHYPFDLREALGIRNDFGVRNKRLTEWLYTTELERTAMHIAYIMKKHAIGIFAKNHYLPAQDELAELYSTEYNCLLSNPDATEMPARDYVKIIVEELLQIERHWQRGRKLKLKPGVVILHDEIFGVVPFRFSAEVLKAAQALYDYMETQLQGRGATPESMRLFAEKVHQVRQDYLPEGWLSDDSLAFGYLMAHAEQCAQDSWSEEDAEL